VGEQPERQGLLLAVEIEVGVVRELFGQRARAEQAAGSEVKTRQRVRTGDRVAREAEHGVVGLEGSDVALDDMGQHTVARRRLVHGLLLRVEREGVGIRRDHHAASTGLQRLRLRDQPGVPARLEIHVGVELEKPVFAVVERHGDRPRPARAARVAGVDAHVAQSRVDIGGKGEAAHVGRALVDDAEVQLPGPLCPGERTPEREGQDRVAVGGDAQENAHGASISRWPERMPDTDRHTVP
jgi:hypothetical protein